MDPRSQRIRTSRRGDQMTARARTPWYERWPTRTCVLPVPHVPDDLTIALIQTRSAEASKDQDHHTRQRLGRALQWPRRQRSSRHQRSFASRARTTPARLQHRLQYATTARAGHQDPKPDCRRTPLGPTTTCQLCIAGRAIPCGVTRACLIAKTAKEVSYPDS